MRCSSGVNARLVGSKKACAAAGVDPIRSRDLFRLNSVDDCVAMLEEELSYAVDAALLAAYREREGHANVPTNHEEDGERLGVWLNNQRTRYRARSWSEAERKGKRVSALSDEEVERLEALGVLWSRSLK